MKIQEQILKSFKRPKYMESPCTLFQMEALSLDI